MSLCDKMNLKRDQYGKELKIIHFKYASIWSQQDSPNAEGAIPVITLWWRGFLCRFSNIYFIFTRQSLKMSFYDVLGLFCCAMKREPFARLSYFYYSLRLNLSAQASKTTVQSKFN